MSCIELSRVFLRSLSIIGLVVFSLLLAVSSTPKKVPCSARSNLSLRIAPVRSRGFMYSSCSWVRVSRSSGDGSVDFARRAPSALIREGVIDGGTPGTIGQTRDLGTALLSSPRRAAGPPPRPHSMARLRHRSGSRSSRRGGGNAGQRYG